MFRDVRHRTQPRAAAPLIDRKWNDVVLVRREATPDRSFRPQIDFFPFLYRLPYVLYFTSLLLEEKKTVTARQIPRFISRFRARRTLLIVSSDSCISSDQTRRCD